MPNPRKPTALHKQQGTYRADRHGTTEPTPPTGPPPPPVWLSARALPFWGELVPILDSMGVLTTADGAALALLCDVLAEWKAARNVVIRRGATYTTTTETGASMTRARPEVAMAADAWKRARAMLSDFGLSPASRGKVSKVPAGEEPSELELMLRPVTAG